MKYIRTKDGRIVKVPNNAGIILYDDEKLLIDTKQKSQTCVYGIVEKQADAIEELCDEFVYETNKNRHFIRHNNNDIVLFQYDEKPIAYYGAIWVENKGLIYVAKMNDNGELELL